MIRLSIDRRVNITTYGRGVPLVLLHGWGFDAHIWHALLATLSHKYQLFLVDLPGCGLSQMMTWDEFQKNLLSQLPAQFALAGWSLGGMIATRLAIEAPMRVQYLLNIASSPRFIEDNNWPGVSINTFNDFQNQLVINPKLLRMQFIEAQVAEINAIVGHIPSIAGMQLGLDALRTLDLREQLSRLKIPVCYIFGRLDPIISRKVMTTMQANYPRFEYHMIKGASHALFLSHPLEFTAIINEFLK